MMDVSLPFLSPTLAAELTNTNLITTLWSSYGHIYRLSFNSHAPLILKHVSAPPSTSESHTRKLLSYRVERYFYRHISASYAPDVKVAQHHPIVAAADNEALLLEDLTREFPIPAPSSLSEAQAKVVLRYLAGFHATFFGAVDGIPEVPPPLEAGQDSDGVWQQGGYWYLDTRREELKETKAAGTEYEFLFPGAIMIAEFLKDPKQPGRTLLHGDPKSANTMFSKDGSRCAMYDFQYVGKGLGAVDLAKFLGTSVQRGVMKNEEKVEGLLQTYYEELQKRVGEDRMGEYTKEVFRKHLDWAVVDWFRFQSGWGFWGNDWVCEDRVRRILAVEGRR